VALRTYRHRDSSLPHPRISPSYGFLMALALTQAAAAAAPGETAARPVRIRLVGHVSGAHEVRITPAGSYRVLDAATRQSLAEGTGGETWIVSGEGAEVRTTRVAPPSNEETGSEHGLRAHGLRFESEAPDGLLRVRAGREELLLPGALELTRGRHGLAAVNEAPLEQYLLGVVAAEGAASFHVEALKALAVAARSYTERNRGRHGECGGAPPGCDLCDTTHCQAYAGVKRVTASVRAAVEGTAGIVALYEGRPIDAVYSADCGGRTQNSEDAWGSRHAVAYLRSVLDAPPEGGPEYCAVNPRHTWSAAVPLETLRQRLDLGGAVHRLWDLAVAATNAGGRVARILVSAGADAPPTGDEPMPCEAIESGAAVTPSPAPAVTVTRELSLDQFRKLFSREGLRGAFFRLFVRGDEAVAEGKGLGHGVGLCQYGAQGMALQGHSFEEILKHYYTGIELGTLPPAAGGVAIAPRSVPIPLPASGRGGPPQGAPPEGWSGRG
jgi:stage II sporulation protein D